MLTRRSFGGALLAAGFVPRAGLAAPAPAWQKLATEPYKGKQDDISFVDPDTGWYGNGRGKLYATRDAGVSWTKVWDRPGTFIRALGFLDAKRGFLGNVGTDYYPDVTDKQPLYRTDDGGATWQPVSAPGIEAVAGICGIDILPVRRVFQGELRAGHVIHAAGRVGGPAAMLRSVDSGDSWTVQDLSKQAGMILDVKFLDQMTGFVAASTDSDATKGEALILRTGDGGRSWAQVYRSGRPAENVWKMSWPTPRIGYATVQSYDDAPGNTKRVIVRTEDAGRTWRELPLVDAPGVQQFGIGFLDARRGWVGAKAGGYETRDGGRSWQPVEFGRAVNKIRVVRSAAATRVFAIGVEVHRLNL